MGSLNFDSAGMDSRGRHLQLPVEVRKSNLKLVKRSLTSERGLELPPGEYYVTVSLPSGEEVVKHVRIEEGKPGTFDMAKELASTQPSKTIESSFRAPNIQKRFARSDGPVLMADAADSLSPVHVDMTFTTQVKVRLVEGNVLAGEHRLSALGAAPGPSFSSNRGPFGYELSLSNVPAGATLLQIDVGDPRPINVMLPVATSSAGGPRPRGSALVFLKRLRDSWVVEPHIEHEDVNALQQYLEGNQLEHASMQVDAMAEEILFHKRRDPVAAAVGAYALLRLNALERLHGWTENLFNWFPWLADGACIRAEHLAREGKHVEAFARLLELEHRGLPIFLDGLAFAVSRLDVYARLGDRSPAGVSPTDARRLLDKLRVFQVHAKAAHAALTYRGHDPALRDGRDSAWREGEGWTPV